MSRAGRSSDWGFPRWRGYGSSREATAVRLCDRHGCDDAGTCPAPKAPNSPDRWYFCQKHAAEYNSKWDYFEGLDKAEAAERDEMRALELLGLEADADFEAVRKAWRSRAKEVHPDLRPGDEAAAKAFQALQLAYEVLRQAEERRAWRG
jgi:hypothetical protein